jgi:glycosyltransferase involved in cell wall biosynthesis
MNVSFVICSKSTRYAKPDACITRVSAQMSGEDELIVIENTEYKTHYSQATIKKISGNNHVVYRRINSGTVGSSRNIAFRIAKNDLVIFVDDDVVINPAMRDRAVAFFTAHPPATVYVNPFAPVRRNGWAIIACAYWNQSLAFTRSVRTVHAYPLACSAFRRSFIRRHRLVCSEEIFTGEDMDLLLSIQEKGGKIYFDPQITHLHRFASDMKTFFHKHFLYAKNYSDIQRLHPDTYRYVDHADNYKSAKNYPLPLLYAGSIRRILLRTGAFIRTNRLSWRYTGQVLVLMTALTAGVYAGEKSANKKIL